MLHFLVAPAQAELDACQAFRTLGPNMPLGGLKPIYDVLLLLMFQQHKPPEEKD